MLWTCRLWFRLEPELVGWTQVIGPRGGTWTLNEDTAVKLELTLPPNAVDQDVIFTCKMKHFAQCTNYSCMIFKNIIWNHFYLFLVKTLNTPTAPHIRRLLTCHERLLRNRNSIASFSEKVVFPINLGLQTMFSNDVLRTCKKKLDLWIN